MPNQIGGSHSVAGQRTSFREASAGMLGNTGGTMNHKIPLKSSEVQIPYLQESRRHAQTPQEEGNGVSGKRIVHFD